MSEESIHHLLAENAEYPEVSGQDQEEGRSAELGPSVTDPSGLGPVSEEGAPAGALPPSPEESKPGLLPVNAKRIAANRRNACKSTGPRTLAGKTRVALNSLRHGHYVQERGSHTQFLAGSMEEMGEDPQHFSRIQQELIGAFRPRGAAQTMLVEDIASLRWQRRRLERAQAALLARRMQHLELEQQRHSLQVSQQISAAIPGVMLRAGLLWAQDSATKFQKILEWLESLKDAMEAGAFSGMETLIEWIYGGNLTLRGATIKARFEELAKSDPKAGDPSGHSASWLNLRRELLAEISSVTQQYQLYLREHVELTATMREECLAPTIDQRWLMRQMNLIDRQIDSKTRLLLDMQRAEREVEEAPEPEGSAPGGERPVKAFARKKRLVPKRIV